MEFYYLTSPAEIEKRINVIGYDNYQPISYSKIFFNISELKSTKKNISKLNISNEKKIKKSKNINQTSFYFEDYLETNKKNKFLKSSNNFQDRIYILFFFFFSLILIFSIKITFISLDKKFFKFRKSKNKFFFIKKRYC